MELVDKVKLPDQRQNTAYYLTEAGKELDTIINSLLVWIYDAMFSHEPLNKALNTDPANGPMAYDHEHLDDLVDMLEKADPKTVGVLLRMLELQTRQNIVSMLCKSGGLVAFTASELGISDHAIHRDRHGVNVMKPGHGLSTNGGSNESSGTETPTQQLAPVDPATAYYNLGPPKGQPKGN
jgi:hypothetical protein